MKKLRYFILIPVLLAGIYLAGPELDVEKVEPDIPGISYEGQQLSEYVDMNESSVENIKKDNEARIIWFNDSLKNKTEYAVVYLHGYSASQGEGDPIHKSFAERYGCNLYLSRLYGHGIYEDNALIDMTPENLVRSAAEAIAIGQQLGEKVILMSTSTGGTLSLYFAAYNSWIHSMILYSPNIRINNPATPLLTNPWGLQIGRMVVGGKSREFIPESKEDSLYWTQSYRMESVIYLQHLIDQVMNESTFKKVEQPVFLGYYYKNPQEQDPIVRVDAMLKMYDQLATPEHLKMKVAFPEAGDHIIACQYKSKQWQEVQDATYQFAESILKLQPVQHQTESSGIQQ